VLRVEGPRGILFLQLSSPSSREIILNISETRRQPDVFALQMLGFTDRQCEVVYWLMAGKRDREIAAILGCSNRTVAGYIATMLRKTGASNRQAAVHVLGEWLRNRGRE
jgi:DNA-binding CsgD family transcriptional regulator